MHPKSTRDEAHFPCIGSIAIPHTTSFAKSGLTTFRKLQRFPETPVSSLEEHQFQYSNSRKALCTPYRLEMGADSLSLTEELSQLSTGSLRGIFPQQNMYEKDVVFSASSGMDPRCPNSKEGRISLQWLKCRLVFHLTI